MNDAMVQQNKWPAYSAYKPSGVEWLGDAPEHWTTVRLRFRVKINPSRSEVNGCPGDLDVSFVPMESVHEYGGLSLDQTRLFAEVATGYTYFRDGDVLTAKITPCFENGKGSIAEGLENGLGFGTTELHVLRPLADMDRRFLFYLTISHAFRRIGTAYMYGAGGQKRVPDDFIRNFRHPIPPLDEQRAIAAFLDRRTARIDALIEKKERQIVRLQEKRTALISHAVTKGLNPNAKMKDSGIEWLGNLPSHWETVRLKYCADLINERVDAWESDLRYTGLEHIESWTGKRIEPNGEASSDGQANHYKAGDVLFGKLRPYLAKVLRTQEEGICTGELLVLRPRRLLPDYLFNYMLTRDFIFVVDASTYGAKMPRASWEFIGNLPMFVPPEDEQRAIAAFLDRETARIDGLIEKIRKSIDLLREYRTALISAAVTGKIDVRGELEAVQPQRKAPPAFRRAVLAAEIADRLHGDPTFGRVKFQKILYLCEDHLGMDLEGNYRRQAAGPLDSRMLRSVEGQMEQQKWYAAQSDARRTTYVPLENAGGHRKYFDNYWSGYREGLDSLIALLRPLDTERCEIVATLFAAWNDLIIVGKPFDDDDILREVRTNWHESKERFDEDRLRKALQWMRDKNLMPQGRGKATTMRIGGRPNENSHE